MSEHYVQSWKFNNGRLLERDKFYASDESAKRGTLAAFRRSNPEPGQSIVLYAPNGDEIACYRAGFMLRLPGGSL
jgi:hypothetical protein